MKILLIEDEDFIRDLYKRQLELAGIPTDAFGMGNDGLNSAHQNPTAYDLVLLDIMLPDTNGLQILKDLKQNTATKQIPVILLTNLSQDMLIKEGFELGAEGYLVKAAYTPAQIVQEVKNILAKKPSPTTVQVPTVVTQNDSAMPQSPQTPAMPSTDPLAATTTPSAPPMPAIPPSAPMETTPPTGMPAGTPPPMSDPLGSNLSAPLPTPSADPMQTPQTPADPMAAATMPTPTTTDTASPSTENTNTPPTTDSTQSNS